MIGAFVSSGVVALIVALLAVVFDYPAAFVASIFLCMFSGAWTWLTRPFAGQITPKTWPELLVGLYLLPLLYFFNVVLLGLPLVIAEGFLRRYGRDHNKNLLKLIDVGYTAVVAALVAYRLIVGF